jgi:antitoxin VapB
VQKNAASQLEISCDAAFFYGIVYLTGGVMADFEKTRVFMSGRRQAVRISDAYRFNSKEVFIRRDAESGDLILSPAPDSWEEVYAALDKAGFPDDFLTDRGQEPSPVRDDASLNEWLTQQAEESLADPRPSVPAAQVFRELRAKYGRPEDEPAA